VDTHLLNPRRTALSKYYPTKAWLPPNNQSSLINNQLKSLHANLLPAYTAKADFSRKI